MSEPAAAPGRLQRLLRNSELGEALFAIANQVLVSGATFLIGIAAARWLGLEQFGRFSMVLIAATLVQGFQNSFLLAPMMTLAGNASRRSRFYFTGLMASNVLLSAVAGLVVGLALGLALWLRDGSVPWAFALSAAAYAATQNFIFTVRRVMFARRDAWATMLLDIVRYILLAVLTLLLWRTFGTITVNSILLALALSALLSAWPYAARIGIRGADFRLIAAIWGRHWSFARWLLPMTLITFLQEQAITLSLGFYLSDEAVGGLRAGMYLLGITHFITMGMDNFLPGGAARAYSAGGAPSLRHYLLTRWVLLGIPIGALILGLAFNAELSLQLAFGEAYRQFAPLLHIFAISYACLFTRDVAAQYFRAIERTDVIFRSFVIGAVIAAVFAVPALKVLGVTGAALLILSTNVTSMVYVVAQVWRLGRPGPTLIA
ncbi:MAG: lipopolysaccharide biosynthesis protein [Hyphomicrobiaceae bacterium]